MAKRKTAIRWGFAAALIVFAVVLLNIYVNREAQPEIVGAGDPRFEQVRRYLEKITAAVGLDTRYEVRGDELVPVAA